MRHSYKQSRYKISFQTKNKVWIYKNSRLRNFYNIRSKIILQTGTVGRDFLAIKNMKWTVARRQMVPYFRKVRRYSCYFKKLFFTKQQLKNFYGGLKEYEIRNFFKKTWNKEQLFKTNIFIGSLEQRLSVILYRMRLLPTIFACNQLIQHKGVLVNNYPITFLNYRVKIGEIVSISKDFWLIFYRFLYKRLTIRYIGEGHSIFRKYLIIQKFSYYFSKNKQFFFSNFKLKKYYKIQLKFTKIIQLIIKKFYLFLKKKYELKRKNRYLIWIRLFYWIFKKTIILKLLKIKKTLKYLSFWGKKYLYLKKINYIWFHLKSLHLNLKKFNASFQHFLQKNFFQDFFTNLIFEETNLIKNLNNYQKEKLDLIEKIWKLESIDYNRTSWKIFANNDLILENNNYLNWVLQSLQNNKMRKTFFKQYCLKLQWYIPQYLEIDFKTLRAAFIYYPDSREVFFPFQCNFKRIISFYKERAL